MYKKTKVVERGGVINLSESIPVRISAAELLVLDALDPGGQWWLINDQTGEIAQFPMGNGVACLFTTPEEAKRIKAILKLARKEATNGNN